MPTVPRLTNTQVAETPFRPVERATLRVPNAFQQAGHAAGEISEVVADMRHREAQAALIGADNEMASAESAALTDPQRGALNATGRNAIGIAPRVLGDLDRSASKLEMGLPTLARQNFRRAWQNRRERIQRQLGTHEAQQTALYEDHEAQSGVQHAVEEAARNWQDPALIASSLSRQRALISIQAERRGWGDEQRQQVIDAASTDTHTGVLLSALAAKDLPRASAYLEHTGEFLKPEVRGRMEKAVAGLRVDLATSGIMDAYERSVTAGTAALAKLDKSGLSDEDLAAVRGQVGVRRNQLEAQRGDESARQIASLEDRIENGSASAADLGAIDALFERSAISRAGMLSMRGAYERMTIERGKNDAAAKELREALSLGIPLSPRNEAHTKALAKAFTAETAGLKMGDPAWQAKALAVTGQVRMLPKQVEDWLDGSSRSPEQSVVIKAAKFYGALDAQAQEAVGSLPSTTRALLGSVADMLRTGATPETAFQTARATIYEVDEAMVKSRRAEYEKLRSSNGSALDNLIDTDFDPGLFSAQPAATLGLRTDFDRSVGTYFAKVGDVDLARRLAWQDMKRVYGVTRINGQPEMQLYPPEAFGARPEDVRNDLAEFLKTHPQASAKTPDDVFVVADALTQRSMADMDTGRAIRPTYALVTRDGDVLLNPDGTRARWALPNPQSLQDRISAEQKRRGAEAIEDAKRGRAADQRAREGVLDRWREPY